MIRKKPFKIVVCCALAAAAFQARNTAFATNGTWDVNANGSWSSTANWTSGIVATGTDAVANFSAVNITADRTVTLDTARTVGSLTFGDTSASNNWILTDGGTATNVLSLITSTGFASITTSTANATINLVMTGNSSLIKAGADSLTIDKVATYLGATTINAGSIILGINNALPDIQLDNNATLNMNGHNQTITDLQDAGLITSSTAATLTINGNNLISLANESIQGAVALTVANGAIVDLGGTNAYTGQTSITSGAIVLTVDNGIPIAGTLVISSGQSLELNNHNQTLPSFTGGTIDNNQLTTVNFTADNSTFLNSTTKFAGNLSLIKTGAGQLLLDTASTYTGNTTINSASNITSGITNALPTTTILNITNSSGSFELNNNNQQLAGITGTGTITNSASNSVILLISNSADDSSSNPLTGSLSLDKQGAGNLTLNTAATYTGTTTVENGTLLLGTPFALPSSTLLINSPGIVDLNSNPLTLAGVSGNGTLTNSSLTPTTLILDIPVLSFDNTPMTGNLALTKFGPGSLSLRAASTFNGFTSVSQGFLDNGILNALPTNSAVAVSLGAVYDLEGFNQTLSQIDGTGNIGSSFSPATLTLVLTAPLPVSNLLTGCLSLDKQGAPTLTLNTAANYTGNTTIEGGKIASGILNALPITTTLSVTPGAEFDLNGHDQQVAGLVNSGSIDNTSATTANFTLATSGNATIDMIVQGNTNYIFQGGNITLTHVSSYTGNTTLSTGNLTSQFSNVLPSTTTLTINSGSTFDLDGNNQTLAGLTGPGTLTNSTAFIETLTINNSTPVSSNTTITGTLNFIKSGSATFTLNTAASYTLQTTISSASTLADGIDNAFPVATFLTISNSGGIFDLNGHNQQFFSIAGPGTITNSSLTTKTLTINTFASLTPATTLTGNLNFDLQGNGVFNLAAPASYTGTTTIDGGTLRSAVDNALPATSLIINSSTTFDLNGKLQTLSSLSGTGLLTNSSATPGTLTINNPSIDVSSVGLVGNWNLIKQGNGVFLQSAGATYTGLTTINAGGIQFEGSASIDQLTGPGDLFVDSNDFTSDGISVADVSITLNSLATIRPNGATSGTSKMNSLLLQGSSGAWTSGFNITNNHLIIEDTASHANTLTTIKNQVAFGRTNNDGIFSTDIASNQVLAVSDNAVRLAAFPNGSTNFGGVNNVDAGSILVTVAFKGDANLDGVVDIQDLTAVANHWQQSVTDWSQGDFDNSGFVDIQDLTAVANNWQAGVGAGGGSSFSQALSLIGGLGKTAATPEPTSLALLGIGGLILAKRRK